MKDYFTESLSEHILKQTKDLLESTKFGEREEQVLRCFFDNRLKLKRGKISKFQFYSTFCEGKIEESWAGIMGKVNGALNNLVEIEFLKISNPHSIPTSVIKTYVGNDASETYELDTKGNDALVTMHPELSLKLRGWIAVMPPWLSLLGSIFSGIGIIGTVGAGIWSLM